MSYVDQLIPFSGSTPLSRHCSALGAQSAQPKAARQTRRYLSLLARRGEQGCTDYESAVLLGLERSTINARRVPWCKGEEPWIVPRGTRKGPTGVKNTVWTLSESGAAAVAAMTQTT